MRSEVPIHILKPHPRNGEYFTVLSPEKHHEIRQSIEAHGIRDPLKVLPDYTIVAGHQRLLIAKELGLEKVPVVILNITPEEAEYLLIADNEERRQSDDDPIRKAKRAKYLAEYWGVRLGKGGNRGNQYSGNHPLDDCQTAVDVAAAVGTDPANFARLLKLNNLIAPLQTLVSSDGLSQRAAYSLAFLPPDEQESLLAALGESGVCGLSVASAQAMRKDRQPPPLKEAGACPGGGEGNRLTRRLR